MSRTQIHSNDIRILESVIAPREPTLSEPVAKLLASLSFSAEQNEEIRRLLDKNNAGSITSREVDVLESYTRVGNFLNLLKAKARNSLSKKSARR